MFFVMLGYYPVMIHMTGWGGYTPIEHTSYYLCIYLLNLSIIVTIDLKNFLNRIKKNMSVTRTNWRDDDINQRIEVTSLDLVLLPGGDTQGVK